MWWVLMHNWINWIELNWIDWHTRKQMLEHFLYLKVWIQSRKGSCSESWNLVIMFWGSDDRQRHYQGIFGFIWPLTYFHFSKMFTIRPNFFIFRLSFVQILKLKDYNHSFREVFGMVLATSSPSSSFPSSTTWSSSLNSKPSTPNATRY